MVWALIRPFLTMVVFTVVFGKLAKLPSEGVPYPILVFAAMLPWQFFSNALGECSNSLISNANLISKVYFPRLIVPTSAVIVSFVDFHDFWHDSAGANGLVQLCSQLANTDTAVVYWYRFCRFNGSWAVAGSIKCGVP